MSLHRRLAVVVLLLALVGALVAAPAVARPPPKSVCAVCAEVEQRERIGDAPVAVEASETVIRVDEDGTGHWTSRVRLNGAAARELEADAGLRRSLVAASFERYVAVENPRNLRSRLDGDTLVVEYDAPRMAHRSAGGVLLVDFFYWHGDSGRWFELAADRVVLAGPDGMALTRVPPGATERSDRAVWRQQGDRTGGIDGHGYVAFAPDGGLAAAGATELAVQADLLQASASDLPGVGPVPVGVLATLVGILAFAGRLVRRESWRGRLTVAVGGAGLLALFSMLVPALAGAVSGGDILFVWLFGLGVYGVSLLLPAGLLQVGLAYGLTTGWRPWDEGPVAPVPERSGGATVQSIAVATTVAVLATVLAAVALALLAGASARPVATLVFVAPAAMFFPLGASEGVDHAARHPLRVAIVAAPAALGLLLGPFGGLASLALPVLLAPWAVVTAFVGLLAWPLGYSLAVAAEDESVAPSATGPADPVE